MAKKYFGTDGIRGKVGEFPITPEFVMRLGYAAGRVFVGLQGNLAKDAHPAVLIGKDPRISGYMFEAALQAGLTAAGVKTFLSGPLPTPAIAYLTRALRLQAGIVISASHNPYYDNGIKFFSSEGAKLGDDIEHAIEAELEKPMEVMTSSELGKAKRIDDAAGRYVEFCKSTFPNDMDLRDLKIVLDCANGATYQVAPLVFHELGAEVVAIGNTPNGVNINLNVGSTHPEALQKAVVEHQADLGIAFDGDGDRVLMVDAKGNLLDGDQLLYIIALGLYAKGQLKGGVAGTLMTNLALEHALEKHQIPFGRANVGDRYVLALLKEKNWQLGGENSGHILTLDKHTSGDGIIAALQVLQALKQSGKTLAMMGGELPLYPQVLINVTTKKKLDLQMPKIQAAVKQAEDKLKTSGRVLLRASGTEPKIRVMVEGQDATLVQKLAESIAAVVEAQSQ
ncbi:MAG: phosphoglucosamine mutase [Methylophilaceae bacterium]|nr:MAG: phosphoglucosamine mutase [Methylophilaceae bacterium]